MARLLGIDYGKARCGLAATDPLRLSATPLGSVDTPRLQQWLADYLAREEVDAIVVGLPVDMRGNPSDSQRYLLPALGRLRKAFPEMEFVTYDERFTSVLAHRAMIDAGMSRTKRRQKGVTDTLSAVIILNDYLDWLQRQPR